MRLSKFYLGAAVGTWAAMGSPIDSAVYGQRFAAINPASAPSFRLPTCRDCAGASTLLRQLSQLSVSAREDLVLRQIQQGNIPDFIRSFKSVTMPVTVRRHGVSKIYELKFFAAPDYLAIGNNRDHLRIPLGLEAAQTVARTLNCILPTPRMVDAIYGAAEHTLRPFPLAPNPRMTTIPYFARHDFMVRKQIADDKMLGIIAGHKKDVVLTSQLERKTPNRVAIYGWHQRSGQPIQPLSLVHGAEYADYSHGIRLISTTALLDGMPVYLPDLLRDPSFAKALADGPIRNPWFPLSSKSS